MKIKQLLHEESVLNMLQNDAQIGLSTNKIIDQYDNLLTLGVKYITITGDSLNETITVGDPLFAIYPLTQNGLDTAINALQEWIDELASSIDS